MKDRNIRRAGSIAGPLITIMSYHGARQSAFKELYKSFKKLGSSAQIAVMESVGKRMDWDGFSFLLEHLDPPQPVWVDDRNNPPASYWKKRWERWAKFKPALKKSLKTLVGKDFNKSKDVLEYIDSQGGLQKFIKKRGG